MPFSFGEIGLRIEANSPQVSGANAVCARQLLGAFGVVLEADNVA
jgi:hypothetical protein